MNDLLAVLYCEFDNIVGPQLTFSYPAGVVPSDVFDTCSEFVITRREVCQRVIFCTPSTAPNLLLCGVPQYIEGSKYHRNALIFNGVLVFSVGSEALTSWHVARNRYLAAKFAFYLRQLELDNSFLSSATTRPRIMGILQQIFQDLKTRGSASVHIDDAHSIHLHFQAPVERPSVASSTTVSAVDKPDTVERQQLLVDSLVPVLIADRKALKDYLDRCDITTAAVLRAVDGVRCLHEIDRVSLINPTFVRQIVARLVSAGIVHCIDLFSMCNMYIWTRALHQRGAAAAASELSSVLDVPSDVVFVALHAIQPGVRLKDIADRVDRMVSLSTPYDQSPKPSIDWRLFVTIAQLSGYLRRVHEYPCLVPSWTHGTLGPITGGAPVSEFAPQLEAMVRAGEQASCPVTMDVIMCRMQWPHETARSHVIACGMTILTK